MGGLALIQIVPPCLLNIKYEGAPQQISIVDLIQVDISHG